MLKLIPAFLFTTLLFSCKKNDLGSDIFNPQNPRATTHDQFYFKGTINGEKVDWVVTNQLDVNTPFKFNSAFGIGDLDNNCPEGLCSFVIANALIQSNNTDAMPQIAAGFVIATSAGDGSRVRPWFEPGLKVFGKPRFSIADPIRDGVYIYYIDKNKKEWVSHYGSGDQTGSFFESLEYVDEPAAATIRCEKRWKAKFKAKLYDRDGNSILIENGEIYSPILPY